MNLERIVRLKYGFATFLIIMALISPLQGFDWFTPNTVAIFEFSLPGRYSRVTISSIVNFTKTVVVRYPNGSEVITRTGPVVGGFITNETVSPVGNGFVTIYGKGGLSANNPLEIEVTLYLIDLVALTTIVKFEARGAFEAQDFILPFQPIWKVDTQGFPILANITLNPQVTSCVGLFRYAVCQPLKESSWGVKWFGRGRIVFAQGGNINDTITIGNSKYLSSQPIVISSADVTVTARTNSLVIGLTLALIGFGVLESHPEELVRKPSTKQTESQHRRAK